MAYLLLGNYLKSGLDISNFWLDVNLFNSLYKTKILESTNLDTLRYMAWSLYIFTSRCFKPGTESPQLMLSVTNTVDFLS